MNEKKAGKNYQHSVIGHTNHYLDDIESDYYKKELVLYNMETFYNLGRNICISILDIWNKNPYSRIVNAN